MDLEERNKGIQRLINSHHHAQAQKSQARKITPKVLEASNWLQDFLCCGPKAATVVYDAAAEAGYSGRTIRRAKSHLLVYSKLEFILAEHRNRWMWYQEQPK
jgi:hypothetical protein